MNKVELLTIEEENIEDEKLRPTGQQTDLRSPSGHSNSDSINRITVKVYTMEDVIERLRLSKESTIQEIEAEGWVNGVEWAKHHAEYDELWRMFKIAARGPEQHEGALEVYETVTELVNQDIEKMADFYLVDNIWVMMDAPHEFVAGFIGGAREVWDEVWDKLCPNEAGDRECTITVQPSDEEVATA